MRELLSENGCFFFHVGWTVSHYVKLILDEAFGSENFINQIIWKRQTAHSDTKQGADHLGRIHDIIFYDYVRGTGNVNYIISVVCTMSYMFEYVTLY